MATGLRNSSSIIEQMKYQPIKQKEMEGAMLQEGRSNVAVSQEDRMLGKQVAGEQSRLQESDRFGEAMAMRKDKLTFAKKVHGEQMSIAGERQDMQADAQKQKRITDYIGIGIGSAAIGVGYLRNRKQKGMDKELAKANKEWKSEMRTMLGMRSKTSIGTTKYNYNYSNNYGGGVMSLEY